MTNPAFWHLALNHIPVLGALFGFLLLAWASVRNSRELLLTALGFVLLAGLSSIPAYLTGDPAKDEIKHMPGVSRAIIHEHEEAAEFALTCAIIMGVLAAASIGASQLKPGAFKVCHRVTLASAAFVTAVMLRTAHIGGEIRHAEIRNDSSTNAIAPTAAP